MDSTEATGRLAEVPLPRLLLTLLEARFDGALTLSRERVGKRFLFHQGAPVFAESNLASESLGVQLMDAGKLDRAGFNRATAHIEQTGSKEGAALLELGLIAPKDLFTALKNQVRIRLLECFGWTQGEYFVDPAATTPADAKPFRLDVLMLVQDGIETHWNGERVFADLAPHMDKHPCLQRGMEPLLERLRSDPAVEAFVEGLDGTRSLWKVMQVARSPRALAAAWVLDAIGAVHYGDTAEAFADGESAAAPEVEIVVAGKAAPSVPLPDPTAAATAAPANDLDALRREIAAATVEAASRETPDEAGAKAPRNSAAVETLRAQIEKKSVQLDAQPPPNHYDMLEVPENADADQIRRAYLLAAKTYHPDALARLGLEPELRERASRVFARIGKAHGVLSDPKARHAYDATVAENATDLDAERLAQAETLYRKAEILLRQGNFRGALEFLEPAVAAWPEECAYQSALGWALFKRAPSDPDRARHHLERALELDADDGVNLFRLSVVLRELGEPEESERMAARAEKLTA